MQTWLILQTRQGPGRSCSLDPLGQPRLTVGRSSHCDVVIDDHKASRHHCDIGWNGYQWEVVDRGSTNGTYVNGVRVHEPCGLRPGDQVAIGETTMVLRMLSEEPAMPRGPRPVTDPVPIPKRRPVQSAAPPVQQPAGPVMRYGTDQALRVGQVSRGVVALFWPAQGLVVAAVVCLLAGAFLPWFRATGSLSSGLAPLVQGIADVVSSIIGEDLLSVTQDIGGLTGFGKLTLGLAVVCTVLLLVDVVFLRRTMLAGLGYCLTSLVVALVMAADLKNLYDLYDQVQSMTVLLGIELADVIEAFGRFVEIEVTLLPGLYLTLAGLGLLFVGGIARVLAALMDRRNPT